MLSFSKLISSEPYVVHGFSKRDGGSSLGHLSSLNMKFGLEPLEVTRSNWSRLEAEFGRGVLPKGIATVNQVHGNLVVEALGDSDEMLPIADADAVFTRVKGLGVAVFTADCVPILLCGGGVVAAVHAGWRGTAKGISKACVAAIESATGVGPSELSAAIGPSIGPCCYEVSEEVIRGVCSHVEESAVVSINNRGGRNIDLALANELQLREIGVVRVDCLKICTMCGGEHYSYRGDKGMTGRQVSVVGLTG